MALVYEILQKTRNAPNIGKGDVKKNGAKTARRNAETKKRHYRIQILY